jgi:hypothetical protein
MTVLNSRPINNLHLHLRIFLPSLSRLGGDCSMAKHRCLRSRYYRCKNIHGTLPANLYSCFLDTCDYGISSLPVRRRLLNIGVNQTHTSQALYLHGTNEEELTCAIIYNAVQLALTLRLNKSSGVLALARTEQEANLLRQLFWVIYAIEKPLVMQLSRYSVSSHLDIRDKGLLTPAWDSFLRITRLIIPPTCRQKTVNLHRESISACTYCITSNMPKSAP